MMASQRLKAKATPTHNVDNDGTQHSKARHPGSDGSSGSPREGRASSSSSSQASKKGKVAEEPEIDLSDSVVVRGWQALRALHAQESKQRFDGVLEAWREKWGKDKDSTASLLK